MNSDDVTIKLSANNGGLTVKAGDGDNQKVGAADDTVIDVDATGAARVTFGGTNAYTTVDTDTIDDIVDDDTVTVTIIDEASGQIIFEQEINV